MADSFANCVPPQNAEAERALLSAVLVDPGCLDDVTPIVRAGDFYFDAHQKLFQLAVDFAAAGKPLDAAIAFEELKRRGQLEDVGGAAFLADVLSVATTGANATWHAGIVRETATRRGLTHVAREMLREAGDGRAPAAELVSEFEGRLFDLGAAAGADETSHIRQAVAEESQRLDSLGADGRSLPGVPTGFREIDEAMGGWQPGFIVVGARPSVGKSAFMLASALAAAMSGHAALIFSLEMSKRQLTQRLLSMLSGVNLKRLRGAEPLTPAEGKQISEASEVLASLPLFLNERSSLRPAEMLSIARRMVRKHGVKVVLLDYVQLLEPDERSRAGRVEQLETITKRLKQMSKALDIPVIGLAQVNRDTTKQDGEKPALQHLKGSGGLEQDADDVLLLWRIEALDNLDVWKIGVSIAKQRNGPTGELTLNYRKSCTRFEDFTVEDRWHDR